MSEMCTYSGTIKKIDRAKKEKLESVCLRVLEENGVTLKDIEEKGYRSYKEALNEELYRKYAIANDEVYDISGLHPTYDEDNIHECYKGENGEVHCVLRFYDGCEGLTEAIEMALSMMPDKERNFHKNR